MNRPLVRTLIPSLILGFTCNALAGIEAGEQINLTIRGVDAAEQRLRDRPNGGGAKAPPEQAGDALVLFERRR